MVATDPAGRFGFPPHRLHHDGSMRERPNTRIAHQTTLHRTIGTITHTLRNGSPHLKEIDNSKETADVDVNSGFCATRCATSPPILKPDPSLEKEVQ